MRFEEMAIHSKVLADILSTNQNSWKFSLWSNCEGLLAYREVRLRISIDDAHIQSIYSSYLASNSTECIAELKQICAAWNVDLPENERIESIRENVLLPKRNVLDTSNVRTRLMEQHLEKNSGFSVEETVLTIKNKTYSVVTSETDNFFNPSQPLVSVGSSSSREMILLEPDKNSIINQHYDVFVLLINSFLKKQKISKISPEHFLQLVNIQMSQIFPHSDEKKINELILLGIIDIQTPKSNGQPCISIEKFLQNKAGICRHHSLVAAYLMDRYITEHSEQCDFKGKPQIMRDNIKGGAHAWVTLICDKGRSYCFDSLNNVMGNLADLHFSLELAQKFGENALRHQNNKADKFRQTHPELS